ncbi:hypothetical protein J4402_01450 [Candidatus Pacearchaeota archaeon]|nr:hypothetical protein [Candidatus Pacearchaeota archaeon]
MIIQVFLLIFINIFIILILGINWRKIRNFFVEETYTYFEVVFIALYFLEQAAFIGLSYFYEEYNTLLVGFFALVVLTTVALNKLMMESKNRRLAQKINQLVDKSLEKFVSAIEQYEKLMDEVRINVEELEQENRALRNFIKKNRKNL